MGTLLCLAFAAQAVSTQVETIHPLFVRLTDEQARGYYLAGRADAKKKTKIEQYVRGWAKDIGHVRSPRGQSWTASYAVLEPSRYTARMMGFYDQREYNDATEFEAALSKSQEMPELDRRMTIFVNLLAWPGVNDYSHAITRAADEADVRAKFVLLPDGNDERPIHPDGSPEAITQNSAQGTVAVPQTNTVTGTTNTTGSATVNGRTGSTLGTINGTSTSMTTVNYTTFETMGFNVYQASYRIVFPLYDKNGKPYFTKDTKTIVLKVIKPSGEQSVTFNLNDYLK